MVKINNGNIKNKYIILQSIVQKNKYLRNVEKLYVTNKKEGNFILYNTDTYINIFHYARWKKLTDVKHVFLDIYCSGKGYIYLKGHSLVIKDDIKKSYTYKIIKIIKVNSKKKHVKIHIENNDIYDFFSISWKHDINDKFYILDASYKTYLSSIQFRPIKFAIVTTTYKRENEINKLVDIYNSACIKYRQLRDNTHFFIINNDIANNKIYTVYSKNITVFTNPCNLGGSGGFARGANLAVDKKIFSHVLFMDDDTLVHDECWLRSFSLLSCIKKTFYDSPIVGTMFNIDSPIYCKTILEALDRNFHRILICGERELDSPINVCLLLSLGNSSYIFNRIPKSRHPIYPYAAWWYCIFPTSIFLKFGYPAPYFFRGDDQEFGLRIRKNPLFINGICVWHPSFSHKKNGIRLYFSTRNFILTTVKYHKKWKYIVIQEIFYKITRYLASNNYEYAAVVILAINDAINFINISQNGDILISRINQEINSFANKICLLKTKKININYKKRKYLSSIAVWATIGGAIIPLKLRNQFIVCSIKDASIAWSSQCVAYQGDKIGRLIQSNKAIKIWSKALYYIIKIFCSKKEEFLSYDYLQ